MLRLRNLHMLSALALALFLALHIGNHIYGLGGEAAHIAYMKAARPLYRNVVIEPLLLALIGWQALSGIFMVVKNWKFRHGAVTWLQAGSGLYLSLFLLIHVSAVLYGRTALHLDTDFRYAATGFHVAPFQWFFAPYYFLALASLFAHLGCAVYWNLPERFADTRMRVLAGFLGVGVVAGTAIDLSLAGALYPVAIPAAYLATYTGARSDA